MPDYAEYYVNLGIAIVTQACNDYVRNKELLSKMRPDNKKRFIIERDQANIRRFFKSKVFYAICLDADIKYDDIINALERRVS